MSCLLVKRVIRHDASPPENDAPRRVIQHLVQAVGTPSCATCVAFATDLPLATVRRVLSALEPVPELARSESACGTCGRWQPVIGLAVESSAHEAEAAADSRIADLGDVVSGSIQHRGSRIDLLSFRTRAGWRPFALVRTSGGALVPDAPAIVLSLMPTKLEADVLAAEHASAWIDKHAP